MTTIGVLALQGAFDKHCQIFKSLGVKVQEVRMPKELELCDGLVIPGGESTCMTRQLAFSGLDATILEFAKNKPVWGTCAGLILLSQGFPLNLLAVTVERNAYGRQTESFAENIEIFSKEFKAVFIRAPKITSLISEDVKVLALHNDTPVLVKQGKILGSSFHPELSGNSLIHQYFLAMCEEIS